MQICEIRCTSIDKIYLSREERESIGGYELTPLVAPPEGEDGDEEDEGVEAEEEEDGQMEVVLGALGREETLKCSDFRQKCSDFESVD